MPKKPTNVPVIEPDEENDEPPVRPVVTPSTTSKNATPVPKPTVVKSSPANRRRIPMWVWITLIAVVLVVAAGVLGWSLFGHKGTTTSNTNTVTNTPETLVARTLDGVPVSTDKANTNIYAVIVENLIDSRPPSGLDKASVVYETLAEGGITRFMALFPVGTTIPQIGPVRSARPYFISWAEEYKPLFVHAGGSPEALTYLKSGKANVYDFNQFTHGGNFIRDDKRAAPHNLYTDTDKLFTGLRHTAPGATPTYTPWTFKDETALDNRPTTVNDIVINFSSQSYKVTYKYDRVQNRYQRFIADQPHVTRDGSQIYAKDIVIERVKATVTTNNAGRMDITVIGTGSLLLFRDGIVTEGTWKKDSASGRTQFLDASGNALGLDPGQIWIEAVPTERQVTY